MAIIAIVLTIIGISKLFIALSGSVNVEDITTEIVDPDIALKIVKAIFIIDGILEIVGGFYIFFFI